MADGEERRARRVAVVQRGVVVAREEEQSGSSKSWIRHRGGSGTRNFARSVNMLSRWAIRRSWLCCCCCSSQQVLLERRGDAVPERHGRVVDDDLRVARRPHTTTTSARWADQLPHGVLLHGCRQVRSASPRARARAHRWRRGRPATSRAACSSWRPRCRAGACCARASARGRATAAGWPPCPGGGPSSSPAAILSRMAVISW